MTPEQQTIYELSERIVKAQTPIRVLDAIKWDDKIKKQFFDHKCKKMPMVDANYYKERPLPFDVEEKIAEFRGIVRDAKNQLGQYSSITCLIEHRCEDYSKAVRMLSVRGTDEFSQLSKELYGSPDDAFYPGGPRLSELGELLGDVLKTLTVEMRTGADDKRYSAEEAMTIVQARLSSYFGDPNRVVIKVSDDIVADAAAGADAIRLNRNVCFSDRDLRYLEVHEGWVHLGTTFNGLEQPICTFLSKGSPASSITQEGLAVITEIFTFSSYPSRMLRLTNRVNAIASVNQGANFIEIFKFFKEHGLDDDESFNYSMRVFRGSNPTSGPFTKDLSYTKGFVLIYNFIRLAVHKGLTQLIPVFFVGKTFIEEIQTLADLIEAGFVVAPRYMPPQFKDLAALSAWMCFSLYLNKFDLEAVATHYHFY